MGNLKYLCALLFAPIALCVNNMVQFTTGYLDPDNVHIYYESKMNDNDEYNVHILYDNPKALCSMDNNTFHKMSDCVFDLKEGEYTIYLKDDELSTIKRFNVETKPAGEFTSPLDNIDEYFLALNGTKTITYDFKYPEGYDTKRRYKIDDESIISIEGDTIKGLQKGTTNLTVRLYDGNKKVFKITVTDLIQPMEFNNNKPYLPCKRYTEEEAHLLDKILESRINEAGYGTRGAAVAAARFLTMEFPYMIRYFNENGRLNGHGRPVIDGEGRYYHKGLYLSEDKYKDITHSTDTGPAMWGCEIYDEFIARMNMNGFTCSGFISWVFKNIGLETGDVGAGDYPQFNDDLSDLGPHNELTEEFMKTGKYKVGDYIGRNGHAAIIIGISEDTIYTAECLPAKLKAYAYGRYEGIVNDNNLTFTIDMDNVYPNGEGNYTNMW